MVDRLKGKVAVVIGQGNVATDVCRILCKTVDELRGTDITQRALEVLAESNIEEVHMIGRRGPVQAAFTPTEIREFGDLVAKGIIDPAKVCRMALENAGSVAGMVLTTRSLITDEKEPNDPDHVHQF